MVLSETPRCSAAAATEWSFGRFVSDMIVSSPATISRGRKVAVLNPRRFKNERSPEAKFWRSEMKRKDYQHWRV